MHYRVGPRHAEDLASEVFLRAVRGIEAQRGSFAAWLFRIAANVAVDHFRAVATRKEGTLGEGALRGLASSEGPAAAEMRHDIQAALARLSDDQRELVALKFIEGLSNAEIAEITGRSLGAIRILQFRALAAMRKFLEHEEHADGNDR